MRLTLLGTRGNIRISSSQHRRHASALCEADGARLLIDAGADWLGRLDEIAPDAILITHAHPDHVGGLRDGAPCPVYATAETHALIARFPIERRVIEPGSSRRVCGVTVSGHRVIHSLRAPAIGYRLAHRGRRLFYVPDVFELTDAASALGGVHLYVGDGATFGRPIVRYRDGEPFGHAKIETQLGWCHEQGVRRAVFTHCGARVVRLAAQDAEGLVAGLGREAGVKASFGVDGEVVEV